MDLSKFKTSDWLKIGGAGLLLIGGFMKWVKVDSGPISVGTGSVFSFFLTGTVPWLLIMGAAVVTVLLAMDKVKSGSLPWPLIMLGATGLGALLLIFRLLAGPPGEVDSIDGLDELGISVGRGIGMIIGVLGGIIAAVGGVLGFKESGGDLNDLKDVNKLKAAFDNDGPTPPAPGGGDMPPPPMPS
jgi:hypothetical protein